MILRGVRTATAAVILLATLQPAICAEWWMLQNTDDGRQCGPPLEADGVVLTPDEILKRFEECKLMDETPSLELNNVMVACAGLRTYRRCRRRRSAITACQRMINHAARCEGCSPPARESGLAC